MLLFFRFSSANEQVRRERFDDAEVMWTTREHASQSCEVALSYTVAQQTRHHWVRGCLVSALGLVVHTPPRYPVRIRVVIVNSECSSTEQSTDPFTSDYRTSSEPASLPHLFFLPSRTMRFGI